MKPMPPYVMLVEDSPTDAELIQRQLARSSLGAVVERFTSLRAVEETFQLRRPDLVISDHDLTSFKGRDVLGLVGALEDPPPFILITGSLDEETAVEYMKAGASDYILKDRLARLAAAAATAMERDRSRRAFQLAGDAKRQAEQRLSLLARATNDAIWELDVAAGALDVNEEFRALVGERLASERMMLEAWYERIHEEDRDRVREGLSDVLDSRATTWTDEYRLRRLDGSIAVLVDRALIMREPGGQAIRVIGALLDVTEKQRLASQLQQSQKMEAIGQLAGGVAHDFNNMLTSILMSTHLMLEQEGRPEEDRVELMEIRKAAERAADLTKQLLAFSRKQVISLRTVALNDTILGVAGMLDRIIGARVEVALHLSDSPGAVRADPGQIEQVLLNLSVNSRDAMPGGGVLTIETSNVEVGEERIFAKTDVPSGPYVRLAVRDTGIGMDRATRGRIFEPFFTTKAIGCGTGLGLSTVYGIVRQHGGHILVESEPGRGTAFEVYLPRVDTVPDDRPTLPATAPVNNESKSIAG